MSNPFMISNPIYGQWCCFSFFYLFVTENDASLNSFVFFWIFIHFKDPHVLLLCPGILGLYIKYFLPLLKLELPLF